jgi:hypothetical protein
MTVTHKFASVISDAADTTLVRPSNWNDTHTVLINDVVEVPVAASALMVAAALNGAF